ncbi:Putative peptidoglycan binding domain-containing protein [Rhizobiales bacterium GAS113]|nr:Putative peptidoglycan binding domain-containing protein [Rhizobiales bacterium GAS113]
MVGFPGLGSGVARAEERPLFGLPSLPAFGPGSNCANPVAESPATRISAPPSQSPSTPQRATAAAGSGKRKAQAQRKAGAVTGGAVISDDPNPTVVPDTMSCTLAAAQHYRDIADHAGWPMLTKPLEPGAAPDDLGALRQRLAVEGDLAAVPETAAQRAPWDDTLTGALRHYQARLGLRLTGRVDQATLRALNVPAADRADALRASAQRLAAMRDFPFGRRYVVVNIPAASVEAVEDGRVVHRYAAVAGGKDHQSPQIKAKINDIIVNPTWTLPASIIRNEVIPKMERNPRYLSRLKIKILDRRRHAVNPRAIDWSSAEATEFTLRQDAGPRNSLGTLKIDMPNKDDVYMHDTPAKGNFAADYRFLSHGCVRVDGIYDLAVWLLDGAKSRTADAWDVASIAHAVKAKQKRIIRLQQSVPVIWVYLDGWESADGIIHFRDNIYGLDQAPTAGPVSQSR